MFEKTAYQALIFKNRIIKRKRQIKKWARKSSVTCYRLYDRDIPEIPLSVDLYEILPLYIQEKSDVAKYMCEMYKAEQTENRAILEKRRENQYAILFLYERPYKKPEEEETAWLETMAQALSDVLLIERTHVIIKTRRHSKGGSQYASSEAHNKVVSGFVQESGMLFFVDLTSRLDTGLFFDHRPLRALIRSCACGKSVLNLYSYTAGFSVYAAQGGARRVESVDLSNTYISWAKKNMCANGFVCDEQYLFTKADVKEYLTYLSKTAAKKNNLFDIIILDPPTFSNSKMSRTMLDINKDWPFLVNCCLSLLTPSGTLYFSSNSKSLALDPSSVEGCTKEITSCTIPDDYRQRKPHRCWKITLQ